MSSHASSDRRHADHGSQQTSPYPADHSQRVYRACRLCARAKARCSGVTAEGCARCRTRHTPCSLTVGMTGDLAMSRGVHDMESPGHGRTASEVHHDRTSETTGESQPILHDRGSRLHDGSQRIMEERVQYLESRLASLERERQRRSSWTTGAILTPQATDLLVPSPGEAGPSGHIDPTLLRLTAPCVPLSPRPSMTSKSLAVKDESDTITIKRRRFDPKAISRSLAKGTAAFVFDETATLVLERDDFPDVQQRGFLSAGQVEMAFHTFKHVFSRLIPMLPFLDVASPAPQHPFVILAMLSHLPEHLPEELDLDPIIDESILYALAGSVSTQVVLALFILSLSPVRRHSEVHAPVTALRLISMAYSIGCDIGLDDVARTLAGLDATYEAYAQEKLQLVLLWSAVVNRYNLIHLQFARRGTLPLGVRVQVHGHSSHQVQQCIRHLDMEAQVVDACRDLIADVSAAEVLHGRQWPDNVAVRAAWDACNGRLEELSRSLSDTHRTGVLGLEIPSIMYGLSLRLTSLVAGPFPPLSPELILESQTLLVASLLHAPLIKPYVRHRRQSPSVPVPQHLMTNLLGCLATTRRTCIILRHVHPELPLPIDMDELAEAETDVRAQQGIAGAVLREMWGQLDDGYPQGEDNRQGQHGDPGDLTMTEADFLGIEGFEWLLQNV